MNGTLVRATALALLGMLLAGCGGGDGDATPTFSSTPTPTAQTTSASPVTSSSSPATVETPEAFIRRWNDASTAMQNSGDSSAYRAVSDGCSACKSTADLVDGYYAAGGFVQTRGWTFIKLTCKDSTGPRTECSGTVANSPTQVKKSATSPTQTLPGGPFEAIFDLTKLPNGSWNMSYLAQQAT